MDGVADECVPGKKSTCSAPVPVDRMAARFAAMCQSKDRPEPPKHLRNVPSGSLADICSAATHVRFTPIATARADSRKGSCLLDHRKRTRAAHYLLSALGHKRTLLVQKSLRLDPANGTEGRTREVRFLTHAELLAIFLSAVRCCRFLVLQWPYPGQASTS